LRQLVQLQKRADDFKALNTELLFVFREESKGIDGLKITKDKSNTSYILAIDPDKQSTKAYSSGNMEFDNYVIDSKGVVRGVIDGTKTDRATADQLISVLKEVEDGKGPK
jgi:peroxiredoxin